VNDFITPFGHPFDIHYAQACNHVINLGHFCMFDACMPASLTFTCAPVGTDNEKAKGDSGQRRFETPKPLYCSI
jgi:hypothetical protein